MPRPPWEKIGPYRALVRREVDSPELRDALARLPELLAGPGVRLLQAGRHHTFRLPLPSARGRILDAVVKKFGRQSPLKDAADCFISNSKAYRTYAAADFLSTSGIGTTPPVACLERWSGLRLRETYFVSLYMRDTECFKDVLVALWARGACYAEFRRLMQLVARGIRRLHDAGYIHNDLGNQNIELTRDNPGEPLTDVAFLDLNRARNRGRPLSVAERARDLSRIALPSGLRPVFFEDYWGHPPPPEFLRLEKCIRARFRLHGKTRRFRHPIRELRYRLHPATAPAQAPYPDIPNQWIWDAERCQPVETLDAHDQRTAEASGASRSANARAARAAAAVGEAFVRGGMPASVFPLDLTGRIRLGIDGDSSAVGEELDLLAELAAPRAFVRISAAEPPSLVGRRVAGILRLRENGVGVAVSLLQTRRSLLEKDAWRRFCRQTAFPVLNDADWFSFGQGANTLRWGVLSQRDADVLSEPTERLLAVTRHPPLCAMAAEAPVASRGIERFRNVVSKAHGYRALLLSYRMDGRAADGAEGLVRQICTLRACCPAGSLPVRVILENELHPSTDEGTNAAHLVRHIVAALSTGLVDEVVLWSLRSTAFGLVAPDGTRRKSFAAVATMLRLFTHARLTASSGPGVIEFTLADGRRAAFVDGSSPNRNPLSFVPASATDLFGAPVELAAPLRAPVYYFK